MIELREMFQDWLQQQQEVVNLDSYTLEPSEYQKIPIFYNDDDEESSTPLRDIVVYEFPLCIAIIPVLSTEEPKDSLIMRDEHLDTIPKKESNEFINFSVENLIPNPSESEDLSNIGKILLIEKLVYDNSSPHPLEEFNSKNSDAIVKSFSPSPIPIEDSDSLIVEIDLSLTLDELIPPGIENDDYDSERDIFFLKEFLCNDSPSLPENDLFHFDVPSSPTKPPDDDGIYFDDEPDTGLLTTKVVTDIQKKDKNEAKPTKPSTGIKRARHKQVWKTENPGKRITLLENEPSKSFAKWLRKEAERELAISKESVSKTVRWISYGPRGTVVKYDAYNINGYTFCTKCHDGKVYQNSRVSVEAIDLYISIEVATTRQAFYYEVLQEIWVLDYHFKKIPLFKCGWVNHRAGGVKRDNLGYTMVDLNNLGHKID
nr:hypothetical protein [Tanacetum cinerariifolium]